MVRLIFQKEVTTGRYLFYAVNQYCHGHWFGKIINGHLPHGEDCSLQFVMTGYRHAGQGEPVLLSIKYRREICALSSTTKIRWLL